MKFKKSDNLRNDNLRNVNFRNDNLRNDVGWPLRATALFLYRSRHPLSGSARGLHNDIWSPGACDLDFIRFRCQGINDDDPLLSFLKLSFLKLSFLKLSFLKWEEISFLNSYLFNLMMGSSKTVVWQPLADRHFVPVVSHHEAVIRCRLFSVTR